MRGRWISAAGRRLSADEIALWRAVAATVDRHAESRLPDAPPQSVTPAASGSSGADKPARALSSLPESPVRRRSPPPLTDLDRRTRSKIVRGRIGIERVIDLHGLSQADAHGALRRFLLAAYADDLRLVLVVTGKGERARAAAGEAGVLKRMVPHWLHDADLRRIVLGFEAAGVPHGGSGALYIRLRRRRSEG
jgi:DNA-nicking Smr family endonuclease